MKRFIQRLFLGLVVCLTIGLMAVWGGLEYLDRTAGEVIRYTERRLIGHPKLEFFALPILQTWRTTVEKHITHSVPSLGKGQRDHVLPRQRYTLKGIPIPIAPSLVDQPQSNGEMPPLPDFLIFSSDEIKSAIANAKPGHILEIAPGNYTISRNISIQSAGLPERPITLRAARPGTVVIESTALEGFHVKAPYWVFENLVIRGNCKDHSACEHAFHVVGNARGTVIRNNRIEDFNAQIKVNGERGVWPDYGLIQHNTLRNHGPRNTENPVTMIDIVSANGWRVADNIISNFIKNGSNRISYGAFMKGAGRVGCFERNVVTCTEQNISQNGIRVGLSFGGGGTGKESCRDQACITEFSEGIAANNVITQCNDFGIYINSANQIRLESNWLINTYGILVRFPTSSAEVFANSFDGQLISRDGGVITEKTNFTSSRVDFPSASQLNLGQVEAPCLPSSR